MVPKVFEPLKFDCISHDTSHNIMLFRSFFKGEKLWDFVFVSFDKENPPERRPLFQKERIFEVLSVRSIFISPNEHQKLYFHKWLCHDSITFSIHE